MTEFHGIKQDPNPGKAKGCWQAYRPWEQSGEDNPGALRQSSSRPLDELMGEAKKT
jgi:hypothetical protein